MFKKTVAMFLIVLTAGMIFTGCGKGDGQKIFVEAVSNVADMGYTGLNNRYSGVIVSGSTQEIHKDSDKKVLKINVEVGDIVEAGDVLFSYDVKAVELALKKLQLECDQLQSSLKLLDDNIKSCKKLVSSSSGAKKLEYEVQLQTYQIEEKEKSFELEDKKSEVSRTKEMLSNANVVSRVTGLVQTINTDNAGEMDENGELIPYMTIIETGTYRVKGTVSELDINDLREGGTVIIRSRVDDTTWTGSIEYIEWDNPVSQQNDSFINGGIEGGESASKYPFYVILDSTDGLLLGQHVYIEPNNAPATEMQLPEYYIVDADTDSPWVWAANRRDRIEKRSVELGEYDEMTCCYEILDGLTSDDYIAFPDESIQEGTPVTTELPTEDEELTEDEMIGEDFDAEMLPEGEVLPGEEVFDGEMAYDSEAVVLG